MISNSTIPSGDLLVARQNPVISLIGFILSVIGFLQSGLFTYTAIAGLHRPTGWVQPPKEWGQPWDFSIATGMDGATRNGSEPLQGAGGPFPHVFLFNDAGDYLGTSISQKSYAGHNRELALEVFPKNVQKHQGQFATFAILAARGGGRDPLCIVDMGLGRPNGFDTQRANAFPAFTAISCGASWYHSGVHRKDTNGSAPCFWLGGYGTQGLQVHLPSHTIGQTKLPIEEINRTTESSHDWFCNRPAILKLWDQMPPKQQVPTMLVTDLDRRAGKTLNDTLKLHENPKDLKKPGRPSLSRRFAQASHHEDTVTIAHELEGLSAVQLCESALSMGPDYVNIPEGKFCRMSDKTLWPTCDHQAQVGPRDDCFDVDSRQLVIGGKVTRSKPYSKEVNYPLKD